MRFEADFLFFLHVRCDEKKVQTGPVAVRRVEGLELVDVVCICIHARDCIEGPFPRGAYGVRSLTNYAFDLGLSELIYVDWQLYATARGVVCQIDDRARPDVGRFCVD